LRADDNNALIVFQAHQRITSNGGYLSWVLQSVSLNNK